MVDAVDTAAPVVQAAEVAGSVVAHDLSMFGLFMQADMIVKSIIIMLLFASFWSWVIIFEKVMKFKLVKEKGERFEQDFWSSEALDEFYEKVKRRANHPYAVVFLAAMEEWARSEKGGRRTGLRASIQERMYQVMSVARNRELGDLEKGIGFLATVGTAAPFIGLFGTVWGIMNSFQSIAVSKNTSLAVVAPGIAEALFATAIGLFAAIPAVIAYNKLSTELAKFAGRIEDFCVEFNTLLSRQSENS
jgi:biopolymer transport protein TolQ